MRGYIALDVGGTQIKPWLITDQGRIARRPAFYPAHAQEERETLLAHFCTILSDARREAERLGLALAGVGMAFPGPFDYDRGVCLMRGIGKYDSLYGLELGAYFTQRFPGLPFRFANDADLFGLGEYHFSPDAASFRAAAPSPARVLYLGIGTGIGSCFLEDGRLVKNRADVPAHGWVYHTPFRDGIADQYLSARGLMRQATRFPALAAIADPKALCAAAREGLPDAQQAVSAFGAVLAEAAAPFAERFLAQRIVVGGQVAKDFDLYSAPLARYCETTDRRLDCCPESSMYAALGVAKLF